MNSPNDPVDPGAPGSDSISTSLRVFAESLPPGEALSISEFVERTEGHGLLVMMIILSLPFLTPIPLPGLSSILGCVIGWLALMLILHRRSSLPSFLARRRVSTNTLRPVLRASAGLLRLLEKILRPRLNRVVTSKAGSRTLAAFLILASAVLILPFPPLVPMTNALPAYSILIVSASIMVQDGFMALIGCVIAILAAVYAAAIYLGSAALIAKFWEPVLDWIKGPPQ